jgi:hypothetical protein
MFGWLDLADSVAKTWVAEPLWHAARDSPRLDHAAASRWMSVECTVIAGVYVIGAGRLM